LVLLAACGGGGGSPPAPAPRSVTPSSGFAGLTTAVQIAGDGFVARPTSDGHVDTLHRAWLGDTELADVTWVDAHTLTATVPAGFSPGVLPLKVVNAYGRAGTLAAAFTTLAVPASVSASIAVSRSAAALGQPVDVTFTVANGGTGAADLAAVTPSYTGPTTTCGAVTPATPVTLGAGESQRYTWSCTGTAEGALVLTATVTATDATSGTPLDVAAASPAEVAIQAPAALAAALSVAGSPGTVQVGQAFTLQAVVSNHGGAAASLSSLTVTPEEAGCGAPAPPLPQAVAGGQGLTFTLTCAAATAGTLAPAVSVRGQDGNSGGLLIASATLVPVLTAVAPTALTATVAATPTVLAVNQVGSVTFYVTNGGSVAVQVTSVAPWATGTGGASCSAVTVPPRTTISAGAVQVFAWTCAATQAGDLLVGGTVNFTFGRTPGSVSPAVPVAVTVTP
jgi:uncharacterized protein (DUF58 family)